MSEALAEAKIALAEGEVPVGAAVVIDGCLIAKAGNRRNKCSDIFGHAEFLAIKQAAEKIGDWRLKNAEVYVTLEPCPMCAGIMLQSRIKRLVYGAANILEGSAGTRINILDYPGMEHHADIIGGIKAEESLELLRRFFGSDRV